MARLVPWLSEPAGQSSGQKLGLDSYGSAKKAKHTVHHEKHPDLESQNSSAHDNMATDACEPSVAALNRAPYTVRPSGTILSRLKAWKPSKEIVYNAVLGTSDGMTVPFAVTASLAGVADAKLVMMAGLSELIAGGVSMAAGGVLGARSDVQKYTVARQNLEGKLRSHPEDTTALITKAFNPYLDPTLTSSISSHVSTLPAEHQLDFLLRFTPFYNDSSPPTTAGAWKIALVLGMGYFSGLIPLIPYMAVPRTRVSEALYISVAVTFVILVIFGYGKTALTVGGGWGQGRAWECIRGTMECLLVVGVSTGLSVIIIRAIGGTL